MPTVYKVLGQSNPAANTDTNVYTVPAGTSAVVSTLNIANLSGSSLTYRVAVRPGGASLVNAHYTAFDVTLAANSLNALTIGMTLAAGDIITVRASSASAAFSVFGQENS